MDWDVASPVNGLKELLPSEECENNMACTILNLIEDNGLSLAQVRYLFNRILTHIEIYCPVSSGKRM